MLAKATIEHIFSQKSACIQIFNAFGLAHNAMSCPKDGAR